MKSMIQVAFALFVLSVAVQSWAAESPADAAPPPQQAPAEGDKKMDQVLAGQEEAMWSYWPAHLYIEAKPGTDRNIGTGNLMIPVVQNESSMLFGDFRGRFDDHDTQEYNLGMGYRMAVNDWLMIGGYAFFDVLESQNDNTYLQTTLGGELFMEDWRLHGNYYLPEGDTNVIAGGGSGTGAPTAQIVGGNIRIVGGGTQFLERALGGFDVELGRRFEVFGNNLWVYGGYFNFHEDGFSRVEGPRFRAEYLLPLDMIDFMPTGTYAVFGGEWQHDNVRGSEAFATIGIRIPIGSSGRGSAIPQGDWKSWAMTSRIVRDIDIVSGVAKRGTSAAVDEVAVNPNTNAAYSGILFASPTGGPGGAGSSADPQDVDTAAGNTAANGVLVVTGTNNTAAGIQLASGATLIGGGQTLVVKDSMGRSFNLVLPGAAGTVNGTNAGNDVVTLAAGSNQLLKGLSITGGNQGLVSNANMGLVLNNVTVANTAGTGVHLTNTNGLTATMLTVNNAGAEGVLVDNGTNADTRTFTGLTIMGSASDGLAFANNTGGSTNTITNASITDPAAGDAFHVNGGNDAVAYNGAITVTTNAGLVHVEGNSSGNIDFDNGTLMATNGSGINLDTTDSQVRFLDTVSLNGGDAHIAVMNTTNFIVFIDATVTNPSTSAGVDINNNTGMNSLVRFVGLDVTTNGTTGFSAQNSDGIEVADFSSGATATINTTGTTGLLLNNVTAASNNFTLNSLTVTNANGANGVTIDTASGTYNLGTTMVSVDAADLGDSGISIVNSAGNVTLANTTITHNGTGIGIELNNNTGTTTLASLNVTTADGTAVSAVNGGTFDLLNPTSVINATGGNGLFIQNTALQTNGVSGWTLASITTSGAGTGIALDTVSDPITVTGNVMISNSVDFGITATGFSSTFTVQGATTINGVNDGLGGGVGIDLGNGGGTFAFADLTVMNTTGDGLSFGNGSNINLTSTGTTTLDTNDHGININTSASNLTFNDLNITDSNNESILSTAHSGNFTVNGATDIETPGADAVSLTNMSGDFTATGMFTVFGGAGSGVVITGNSGNFTVNDADVSFMNNDGFVVTNSSMGTFQILGGTIGNVGRGVDLTDAGVALVSNTTINGATGFAIRANSTGANTFAFSADGNTTIGTGGFSATSAGTSTLQLNLTNNEVDAPGFNINSGSTVNIQLGGALGQGMTFNNSDNGNIQGNGNTTGGLAPTVNVTGNVDIIDGATIPTP